MKQPLVWRPAAQRDAEALVAYYRKQGGARIANGFLDALEAALELLGEHAESGSTRHAELFPELPVPLRFHPLRRFPRILVYYLAAPERVEIVRIWDAARGLEALVDRPSAEQE